MNAMRTRLMLRIAGEIGLKSARTRRRFLRYLVRNVKAALERTGVAGEVENRWSRLFVDIPEPERAREALSRVFGVHSVAEVAVLPASSLDELVAGATDLFRDRVAGRTFAVRARRRGEVAYGARDVAVHLGAALLPHSAGVDLNEPDVEVALEIRDGTAHAVIEATAGPGGLPIGSGGRAVALFSGGFDSPVAAWMAMRRGTTVEFVVCDIGGCAQTDSALEVARELVTTWTPGIEPRVHVVDLVPVIAALRERVNPRIRQVLLKRAMYRVATLIARETRADAIVTGESLGQVSTQTLRNLAVAEEAAGVPILRPLIGMDKEEIIARARRIGTHDASVRVREYCAIATGRVETAARLREVLTAEGQVDESFIAAAVWNRRVVDLLTWQPERLPHVVEDVPENAVIVDVREADEGATVGDVRKPFSDLDRWVDELDRDATYLFVCTVGARSEVAAGEARARGYDAFSLAGGMTRLPSGRAA
jgi:thiamine biosynthesis protein ThiI